MKAIIVKKTDGTYRVVTLEADGLGAEGLKIRDAIDYTGDRLLALADVQTIDQFEKEIERERAEVRAWVEQAGDVENLKRIAERAVRTYRARCHEQGKKPIAIVEDIIGNPADPRD
jgi:hypothetical protein